MRLTEWEERNSIRSSSNKKNRSASYQEKGKQDCTGFLESTAGVVREGRDFISLSIKD